MLAIRWSDNDRYFGPFTYSRDRRGYRPFSIMLGSGDNDDYPGCRLRLSGFGHTFIIALPAVLKPWRQWVDTSHYEWSRGPGSGYWDVHEREYGFTASEGSLHWHYGPQTNDSDTDRVKVWFFPWREHHHIRHSLYDLEGEHFADLPEWGFRHKNGWTVKQAIEAACPVRKFEFDDFDGERIVATCRIEEREWKRGKGIFRLLYLGRNAIRRSLDLSFSREVGHRKGSWKGGTIGHSIDMLSGELHEAAFRRYCDQNNLTFAGDAIATAAGTDETRSGSAEGKGAGRKASPKPNNIGETNDR